MEIQRISENDIALSARVPATPLTKKWRFSLKKKNHSDTPALVLLCGPLEKVAQTGWVGKYEQCPVQCNKVTSCNLQAPTENVDCMRQIVRLVGEMGVWQCRKNWDLSCLHAWKCSRKALPLKRTTQQRCHPTGIASYRQWSQRQNESDPGSEESKGCKCWSLDFVINLDFRRRGFHNSPVSHESKIPDYRSKLKQLTISKFMMSHRALKSLPKVCKNLKESSNMFLFLSLSLSITVRVCVCVS